MTIAVGNLNLPEEERAPLAFSCRCRKSFRTRRYGAPRWCGSVAGRGGRAVDSRCGPDAPQHDAVLGTVKAWPAEPVDWPTDPHQPSIRWRPQRRPRTAGMELRNFAEQIVRRVIRGGPPGPAYPLIPDCARRMLAQGGSSRTTGELLASVDGACVSRRARVGRWRRCG